MTRPDPIHLTLTASPVDAVEHGPRQVAGVVVLYGADPASTSSGAVVFEPGSLTWSDDLTRVKLLLDHDYTQPVGYATASVEDDDGVAMAFTLVDHPRADAAFDEVLLGLRDGFSVGATATEYSWDDYDVLHIHAGTIREVTLCAIPALDDARVTDIRATHHEETPMTRSTRPVPAALQATTPTVHRHGVALTPPAPSSRTPRRTSAPDSAPSAPDSAPSAPDSAPSAPDSAPSAPDSAPSAPQHEEAAAARLVHASAPVAAPTGHRRVTLAQAARIVSDVVRRGGTASDVRAALADITPTSLPGTGGADMENPWLRDTFLGELWTASKSERPWIDLLGAPRDITGLKVYGWRWEVRPVVGDYAGDKAEIPTNSPKIVPAEAPVTRTAGGWDIDRIYVDLGDASPSRRCGPPPSRTTAPRPRPRLRLRSSRPRPPCPPRGVSRPRSSPSGPPPPRSVPLSAVSVSPETSGPGSPRSPATRCRGGSVAATASASGPRPAASARRDSGSTPPWPPGPSSRPTPGPRPGTRRPRRSGSTPSTSPTVAWTSGSSGTTGSSSTTRGRSSARP